MTGVMDKFRMLSRALSVSDDEKDIINRSDTMQSSKSTGLSFFSKLGVSNSNSSNQNDRKHKTLLVIDTKENDWIKAFKGMTLHGNIYDLRVEQASFSELSVVSSSEKGVTVSMKVLRSGTVVARSFRPDFVLIRESSRNVDCKTECRNLLFGLMHGNVPSLNSLTATYSFMEKPVVYSSLLQIQKRVGKDSFPLTDQTYYQSYKEMILPASLPVVVKVGSANSGFGKVCVASPRGFQDVASLVAVTGTYASAEPFLDGRFDIRILKIGGHYKVYKRKSLSDSWKANQGTSVIEEIALTERYKLWADECSNMFGGVDILCVEAIHTKDDKEYIFEVNDTGMIGGGDHMLEDMKWIAQLVVKRMEKIYHPHLERDIKTAKSAALAEALNIVGGPGSPDKLKTSGPVNKRPATCEPMPSDAVQANGVGPIRRATSQENVCSKGTKQPIEKPKPEASSKPSSRRGSFAGRVFSALTD